MLYLHHGNDSLGIKVKEYLLDISAAHKEVAVNGEVSFIRENDKVIEGEVAIFRYLEILKRDLEDERLLSADACIMNPRDGNIC